LLILVLFAFGIRTSWFQTFLAQQTSAYLSSELGTEIRIDKVDILFFDLVDIEGVYVEDKIKDTLLNAGVMRINIGGYNLAEPSVDIENVLLTNTDVNIIKYKGDSTFNFQHFVDYFASQEEDTTSSNFKLHVHKVSLATINFKFQDENAEAVLNGLDYSNIWVKGLSGTFSNFSLENENIGVTVENLGFKERSGLDLVNLSAEVLFSPTQLRLTNLNLGLHQSTLIADYFEMNTPNGSDDYSDFVNKVILKGAIHSSTLNLADLSFFVPQINGMDADVNLHAVNFEGPVYGMMLNDLDLSLLNNTRLKGNLQIPNLDNIDSARFEEDIQLLSTSISDLERLKLTPFLAGQDYIKLPDNLNQAGVIRVDKGYFSGVLSDFKATGRVTSGLGNISALNGLRFKLDDKNVYHYHGISKSDQDIVIESLHLGSLTGNQQLGITSGYLSIKEGSKGFDTESMQILVDGEFSTLGFNGYDYKNITIKNGKYAKNRFTGAININDEHLVLDYDGFIDFDKELIFDFQLNLAKAELVNLYLLEDSVLNHVKTNIHVNIHGTDVNTLYGSVDVSNLSYQKGEVFFETKDMRIDVHRNELNDSIKLRSAMADIDLIGKFDLINIYPLMQYQLSHVLGNFIQNIEIDPMRKDYFKVDIVLKEVNEVLDFVDTNLYIAPNTRINSSYSSEKDLLTLDFNSSLIGYKDMQAREIKLAQYMDSTRANTDFNIENAIVNDSIRVKNVYIDSDLKDNLFTTTLGWDGDGDVEPALFAFRTSVFENYDILTEFDPSFFFLQDNKWNISPSSSICWNPETIEVTDFDIVNGPHAIRFNGKVSSDPNDWLYFEIDDFDLADLNGLLGGSVVIGGIANVDGGISDVYNSLKFNSISDISNLVIDNEIVGDVILDNTWDKETSSIGVNGALKRNKKETFRFSGNYFTEKKKDNLALNLTFDHTDIAFLNAFSDPELYTNIKGILNGALQVSGELTNPIIEGDLDVVTANVHVPMLNVGFGMSGILNFGDGELTTNGLNITDQEGNNALALMQIYHYDWAEWNYDITLDMESPEVSKRFLLLNSKYNEGDFYYGTAYVSGMVNIFGEEGVTEVEVNAKTEKGTDLKLAMYGTSELDESSFIIYDTLVPRYDKDNEENNQARVESSGLILKMNFDVTRNAKVAIIFDPIYEDQIEVVEGIGDISINMDQYGVLEMFGQYTILDGDYFMRMKNIVSKDFNIRNGSNVVWTGSPYDARIDVYADFQRFVSLEDIMPPTVTGETDRTNNKEKVIGTLHMTETLMAPALSFDINSPTADDLGKAAIEALKADADHLNKQFFSLLVLNKFLPNQGAANAGSNVGFGLAENQINAILGNISENYDIAANLENGKTAVGVSTQINDKISVTTSLGVLSNDEESSGEIVGDVVVEYKLNEDGTFTVNFFNESNEGSAAEIGPYTQGIGLHYQESFNNAKDFKLLQGFLNIFRSSANDVELKTKNNNGKRRPVEGAIERLDVGQKPENELEN
jgi:hypothetical protein